ncbi:hypothetical protein TNIN_421161 [Trichonephila inaurata madagascariensis]|uniref:Uncharacterized protein n=1 Tax=Trichonephila inaurata madagascariensis TaxID=2747483 RepID=A0A8X7CTE4_9ARAC|nr:hypothetical protein TNIN_421161 [Trichonephila inaurata madagascariensis]
MWSEFLMERPAKKSRFKDIVLRNSAGNHKEEAFLLFLETFPRRRKGRLKRHTEKRYVEEEERINAMERPHLLRIREFENATRSTLQTTLEMPSLEFEREGKGTKDVSKNTYRDERTTRRHFSPELQEGEENPKIERYPDDGPSYGEPRLGKPHIPA